jgi:hypothetical protein
MTNDDRQAFTDALTPIADTFRVPLTEGLLRGYWLALEDLPIEAIQRGCLKVLRYEDKFPPPVTIRLYAREGKVVL